VLYQYYVVSLCDGRATGEGCPCLCRKRVKCRISHLSLRCIVNPIQYFLGSPVLSSFRRERLLRRFADLGLPVSDIHGQFEHYVWTENTLDQQAQDKLTQLLDYGVAAAAGENSKNALTLRVIPRL